MQRIALVALTGLDREALCYAFNTCQRLDARLDILTDLPRDETSRVVVEARGSADTPWRFISIDGESGDAICHYARNQSGLLFLVSGIGDELARRLRQKARAHGLGTGVPWVEVKHKRSHG